MIGYLRASVLAHLLDHLDDLLDHHVAEGRHLPGIVDHDPLLFQAPVNVLAEQVQLWL